MEKKIKQNNIEGDWNRVEADILYSVIRKGFIDKAAFGKSL